MAQILYFVNCLRSCNVTRHIIVSGTKGTQYDKQVKASTMQASGYRFHSTVQTQQKGAAKRGKRKYKSSKKATTDVIQVQNANIMEAKAKVKRLHSQSFDQSMFISNISNPSPLSVTTSKSSSVESNSTDGNSEACLPLNVLSRLGGNQCSDNVQFKHNLGDDVRWIVQVNECGAVDNACNIVSHETENEVDTFELNNIDNIRDNFGDNLIDASQILFDIQEYDSLNMPPEEISEDLLLKLDKPKLSREARAEMAHLRKQEKEMLKAENKKQLEEQVKKGREVSFNISLEAYLSVCVHIGMVNRATNTLLYYRKLKLLNKGQILSVKPYNILLFAHAQMGSYSKMEAIMSWIQMDKMMPDIHTYAALLICLGKMDITYSSVMKIEEILLSVKENGFSLDQLFSEVEFIVDNQMSALKAVRQVLPNYDLVKAKPKFEFACPLVNNLNETMMTSQKRTPFGNIVSSEKLHLWAEEQLEIELKGRMKIESIYKTPENKKTLAARKKLDDWESQWRTAMHFAFLKNVDLLRHSFFEEALSKNISLYPYLLTLPPEEFVDLMIQELLHLVQCSDMYAHSRKSLCRRLGELVFNRYTVLYKKKNGVIDSLKDIYRQYCDWYLLPNNDTGVSHIPRVTFQELSSHGHGASVIHVPVRWPPPVFQAIGQFLYQIITTKAMVWTNSPGGMQEFPAIGDIKRAMKYTTYNDVQPSPILVELYRKAASTTLMFNSNLLPMVSIPLPWLSVGFGGYLLQETKLVRVLGNAHQQLQRMEEVGNQQLYPVMDTLNQLGCVPWVVNKAIVDLIIQVFNKNGSDELDIPEHPSKLPVPPPIPKDIPPEEEQLAKIRRQEFIKKKAEMHSLWCDALYKLSLANHFRDRVFWLPHNMDFRGRVYPSPPHLSHLSSDLFRATMKFAKGEELGPNGLRWLKLHLINLTGFKKRDSCEGRLKYCEEVMNDILDSADNPLTGHRWWTKSDEPWQTLAACIELANAIRSGNPEKFISHLPIHQDGSCNGLQHYAALGRDEAGAISVNLASSDFPQDVYSMVALAVEKLIAEDAENGHELAMKLKGKVKRKVIKQTVMTTVYGVTKFGARQQIEKQLKAGEQFSREENFKFSVYLTGKTFLALQQMFVSTKKIQEWLTNCATLVGQVAGANIEWVTPVGFPVVQPYVKHVKVNKPRALPTYFSIDMYSRPDVRKHKNAFPPNFIHSLDSTHMMLTSLFCQEAGICFISVHDCFWTHAATVEVMNKICREQFVVLHSQPILKDLSSFLFTKFHKESGSDDSEKVKDAAVLLNETLQQVPIVGKFDIKRVLDSVYFFS